MSSQQFSVTEHPQFGFMQLNPIPTDRELDDFYKAKYYQLLRQGGRAPEIRCLTSNTPEAEAERRWLNETLHADVFATIRDHAPSNRVLDAGCGTGELLRYLTAQNISAEGFEPSEEAAQCAVNMGLKVSCRTIKQYLAAYRQASREPFAAVTMMNVLEHVRDPISFLQDARELLMPGGILIVRVPNDFTEIQAAAHAKVGGRQWWVAIPDHINYFNVTSLSRVYESLGFAVVDVLCDFPMEMFLLFGDDYTKERELGPKCHQKRVSFELSIPGDLRRQIDRAFAAAGIGRDIFMVGKKNGR
jgi:SAM-dependent methyltransferase